VHAYYDETRTLLFQVQRQPWGGGRRERSAFASSQILSCEEVGAYVRQLLLQGGGTDEASQGRCTVHVTSDSDCRHHPLVQCLLSWTGEQDCRLPPAPTAETVNASMDDDASSVALSSSSSSSQESNGVETKSARRDVDSSSKVAAAGRWKRLLRPSWTLSAPALLAAAGGTARPPRRQSHPSARSSSSGGERAKSRRTTSSDTQAATADETILIMDRVPSFVADRPPPIVRHDSDLYCASAIRIASDLEEYPHETMRSFAQQGVDNASAVKFASNASSAFRPTPSAAALSRPRSDTGANRGGFHGVPSQDQGVWI
jgi:hypothetical protein